MRNYIEIRFKLPVDDFEIYKSEAEEIKKLGHNISPTAQIKAEVVKQANIKRELKVNIQKGSN
ncbi:hypothetical protein IAE23_25830 [Bacillus sp. S35]|nr:hypothetical protein [Bacillus sp. S35]